MSNSARIAVLLSSHNGEAWIRRQIESVMQQDCSAEVTLLIRDDGSKDSTKEIIREYREKYHNIELSEGENLGLVGSFFALLRDAAEKDFDYYSFCDQDDFWMPDKLQSAVNALEPYRELPCFYGCRSELTDADLNRSGKQTQSKRRDITFFNTAIQNICQGHNQVITKPLAQIILQKTPADFAGIYSHDYWIINAAAIAGKIVFENQTHTLYRQHGDNQLGYGNNRIQWFRNRLARLKKKESKQMALQLRQTVKCFDAELQAGEKSEMQDFFRSQSSFLKRLRYIFRTRLYRQKKSETLLFKILYLFGGYNSDKDHSV